MNPMKSVPVEKRKKWEKEFDEKFEWFIKLGESQLETSDTPDIKAFISQALQASVEEERKSIAEAMKRIPIYGSDDYTRGAKEMVELIILAIINKHQ